MFNRRKHHHHCNNPICCPPKVFPTQVAPAQVSPTQEVVRTNIFPTVVPNVHPTHITNVNRHVRRNEHFFPVTQSTVNEFQQESSRFNGPSMVGGAQSPYGGAPGMVGGAHSPCCGAPYGQHMRHCNKGRRHW